MLKPKKIPERKALPKNKHIQDVKTASDIQVYKSLAKMKKLYPTKLNQTLFEQKMLANSLIVQARVSEKVKMLSQKEQAVAIDLVKKIYNEIILSTNISNPKYFEFTKELIKSLNRREGSEILEILKLGFEKIKLL